MMSKVELERIDRSLRDILKCDKPFGVKSIIMGGDFRQILPVEKTDSESVKNSV